eukprot:441241-Pleurochrysis_carterae.AAC.1
MARGVARLDGLDGVESPRVDGALLELELLLAPAQVVEQDSVAAEAAEARREVAMLLAAESGGGERG